MKKIQLAKRFIMGASFMLIPIIVVAVGIGYRIKTDNGAGTDYNRFSIDHGDLRVNAYFESVNLGVDTNNPEALLHVGSGGTPGLAGAGDAYIQNDLEVDGTLDAPNIDLGITQGSLVFDGASGLTQDNANLFWDDTNNRLGIGTSAPNTKLTIKDGGIRFTGSGGYGSGADTGIFGSGGSTGDLSFVTNGSIQSTITDAGNLGLGTSSPDAKLEIVVGNPTKMGLTTNGYVEDASGLISRNYVSPNSWTEGTGSESIFTKVGVDAESERLWGVGANGARSLLWACKPDSGGNQSGGWQTITFPIDHTKSYRYVVYAKKTGNLTNGTVYFGCYGSDSNLTTLTGGAATNPYFFASDLPELDKWYLIVGFIQGSGDTNVTHYGGVYDVETGEKKASCTDYEFKTTATSQLHRAFLYYDSVVTDRLYLSGPRVEAVDGTELPIGSLLSQKKNVFGNFGVNTSSPSEEIHVKAESEEAADVMLEDGDATNKWTIAARPDGVFTLFDWSNVENPILVEEDAPTDSFTIDSSGNIGIGLANSNYQLRLSTNSAAKPTSNLWTIYSDKRLKENIADIDAGLDELLRLKPKKFDYKPMTLKSQKTVMDEAGKCSLVDTEKTIPGTPGCRGFVAQEIGEVFPCMVTASGDLIEGSSEERYLMLNTGGLDAVMVKAIQELSAKIDAQQVEINALRAQIKDKR